MALAAAALLAIGLVAAITLAGGQSTGADDVPAPEGPAVRIGGRAGLVTVGIAARARSLELTLIGPDIDGDEADLREIRLTTRSGGSSILHARSCGPACYLVPAVLERGVSYLRLSTAFAARPGVVSLRIPLPALDAGALLQEAVRTTGRVPRVTVQERLTSDTNRRFFTKPSVRVSGSELITTYAADFAKDVRELPSVGRLRRIAYALPGAGMWVELWIRPDGVIVRDRITGPNHLIVRRITPG